VKVSIITVCRNCETTIGDTIRSVAAQDYPEKEHIIIDGASTDRTMDIVRSYAPLLSRVVSEPDRGIYDAMNKGIEMATGDIVGILNADDIYHDNGCLTAVMDEFERTGAAAVCGSLVYVTPVDLDTVVRVYPAGGFAPWMFAFGMMPPHPGFFVRRHCYERLGLYRTDYTIAADFELLLRFLKTAGISYTCLTRTLVKMRTGGVSTRDLKSTWCLNREILRACRDNQVTTTMVHVLAKYIVKVFQLFLRPA
jgi:glycosyltransferase involved in cell wall biosynthesis